jgi:hypothetical protein
VIQQQQFKSKGGIMVLNSFRLYFLLLALLGVGVVQANDEINEEYLTLSTLEVRKISTDVLNQETAQVLYKMNIDQVTQNIPGAPNEKGLLNGGKVGKVIGVASDLVALGEGIYNLVNKGKPSNKSSYAPITVIPRVGGKYVDIMETENWSVPKKVTYQIIYKNLYGMEVVKFRYSVIYSFGGTYNGKGAYITAAQIIPDSIMTSWGFDFSAHMKLGGIQNHGSKENPVAGAIMIMEYRVETVLQASLESDSYHITGRGGFKPI